MKNIVILGSTGSIGVSALEVISKLAPKGYGVLGLSANKNADKLLEQIHKYKPRFATLTDPEGYEKIKNSIPAGTRLLPPDIESLTFLSSLPSADLIINSVVGAAGFMPLMTAIKNGKTIALANKEPIVMAGQAIMEECFRWKATIIPVDSEPSAIFQSLENKDAKGGYYNFNESISRFLLTASGGPFLHHKGSLAHVTPEQALDHPRWSMGKKITVDSSTLMNKGFEAIEIMHMFNVPMNKIEIVIHPQSIVHSAVEYKDGSILAQMSVPDMKIPIQYAITYPKREACPGKKLTLTDLSKLEFSKPNFKKFPCLELALSSADKGGAYPAVLSAADELAVEAFLKGEIKFTDIAKVVYSALKAHKGPGGKISLSDAVEADSWAREQTAEIINSKKYKKAAI